MSLGVIKWVEPSCRGATHCTRECLGAICGLNLVFSDYRLLDHWCLGSRAYKARGVLCWLLLCRPGRSVRLFRSDMVSRQLLIQILPLLHLLPDEAVLRVSAIRRQERVSFGELGGRASFGLLFWSDLLIS